MAEREKSQNEVLTKNENEKAYDREREGVQAGADGALTDEV